MTSASTPTGTTTLLQLVEAGRIVHDFYCAIFGIWHQEAKKDTIEWLIENFSIRLPEGSTAANCAGFYFGPKGVQATKIYVGAGSNFLTSHFAIRVRDREDFDLVKGLLERDGLFSKINEDLMSQERVYWVGDSGLLGCSIHAAWRSLGAIPVDPATEEKTRSL